MALIDFFNPNAPQIGPFNYGTEADKVKRKRALAQALQEQAFAQDKTQVVPGGPGGFVVPNNRFSPLAKMLQAYMGVKAGESADSDQRDLDKRSADELTAALADKPWEQRARDAQVQREADAELLRESRRGSGVEAGDAVEAQPEGAQSFPVREQPAPSFTPLPPQPQLAKALQAPADPGARVGTEKGRATNTSPIPLQPGIDLGPANPATAGRKARMAALLQGQPPTPPMPAPAQAQAAPMQGAPAAMPDPMAAAPVAPPTQPPSPVAASTGPLGDARSLVEQAGANAQPTQSDQIKQIMRIAGSGPLGQQVANGMFQQAFGPKANEFDFITVKDSNGAESVLAINKRNPTQRAVVYQGEGGKSVAERRLDHDIAKDDREAGIKADEKTRGQANALQANQYAIRKIDELIPRAGDATGMDGKLSNWFNKVTGIPTDAAAATEELNSIKGTLMAQAMAMTKEQSGSAAGLSQNESEALTKSIASLDPRIGQKELVRQLGEVRRQFLMYQGRLQGGQGGQGGVSPPGAAPATRLDWRK